MGIVDPLMTLTCWSNPFETLSIHCKRNTNPVCLEISEIIVFVLSAKLPERPLQGDVHAPIRNMQYFPGIFFKISEDIFCYLQGLTSIVGVASYHICVSFNEFNHFGIPELIFCGILLQFVTGKTYNLGDFFAFH